MFWNGSLNGRGLKLRATECKPGRIPLKLVSLRKLLRGVMRCEVLDAKGIESKKSGVDSTGEIL